MAMLPLSCVMDACVCICVRPGLANRLIDRPEDLARADRADKKVFWLEVSS